MHRFSVIDSNTTSGTTVSAAVSPTDEIIAEIRAGRMVILVDEEDRENEGDLVLAAQFVTPEAINFMAKHARGLICLTLTEQRCRQLDLPLMVQSNRSSHGTNFTVSIEAAEGVSTGISAADRARTVQVAVAADAKPGDIVQPGHIFPVMAQNGGVLVRAGHTEAGCDLGSLAGVTPAAVICEIINDDGTMARLPDLIGFGKQHGLKIGTIADLIKYRSETERLVERLSEKQIETPFGAFRLIAYADRANGSVHLALARGDIQADVETLVRVHEPLSVLDLLDASSKQHSFSVHESMRVIAEAGSGVIVLLRSPEGDADLAAQIAMAPDSKPPIAKWDPRTYGIGAQILRDLNVGKMRLLARPAKMPSMAGWGLEITGYFEPAAVRGK